MWKHIPKVLHFLVELSKSENTQIDASKLINHSFDAPLNGWAWIGRLAHELETNDFVSIPNGNHIVFLNTHSVRILLCLHLVF